MKSDFSLSPRTRSGRPRRPIEIAMTPMIDVIFLLLVFFLATSSFQMVEHLLPSGVSKSAEKPAGGGASSLAEPTDDVLDQIVIKLSQTDTNNCAAEVNGTPLAKLSDLRKRLRIIAEIKSDVPVIIDPASDVRADSAIQAYDFARQAGFLRVYFATRQPK